MSYNNGKTAHLVCEGGGGEGYKHQHSTYRLSVRGELILN
jgi:hypothetical protein